jgi:2-oxoglutarate dehydrogenase E1 component
MTPKSLLRHKRAVSKLSEFGPGSSFHRVLWDDADSGNLPQDEKALKLEADENIQRVVLCSGKVYYDLFEERERLGERRVQLLRVEQIFPFPRKALAGELIRFPNAEIIWCQEEPKNQGAWTFIAPCIEDLLEVKLGRKEPVRYTGRKAAASVAAGQAARHVKEMVAFLDDALSL